MYQINKLQVGKWLLEYMNSDETSCCYLADGAEAQQLERLGQLLARRIDGKLQLMALDHAGGIELGFNLQATELTDSPEPDDVLGWAAAELPDCARVRRAYVVGLAPGEARALAVRQLGMRRPTF